MKITTGSGGTATAGAMTGWDVSSGTRAGVATSLGIEAGDLLHTILAVLGVSAILMASPVALFPSLFSAEHSEGGI